MDNTTKALALARLGIKVFPVDAITKEPVIEGGRGCYDGTNDAETIATWFMLDYIGPAYAVAVWAGGSDLFTLDIDRKNDKDGFESIEKHNLIIGDTWDHDTPNHGTHYVYASSDPELTSGKDVKYGSTRLNGVDIRAGGSYFVWWGDEVPESRDQFSTDIPAWAVNAATPDNLTALSGSGFTGNVSDWLDSVPGQAEPTGRVKDFMARIPETDFGHNEMVDLVWGIVRMGSEREGGIRIALEKLRNEWLRDKYNTQKNRKDFYTALIGAINKAGRVQNPVPPSELFDKARAIAEAAGIWSNITRVEVEVSETIKNAAASEFDSTPAVPIEIALAQHRREIFDIAAKGGISPSAALGIVSKSKAFQNSATTIESAWFNDGEAVYHDYVESTAEPEEDNAPLDTGLSDEELEAKQLEDLAEQAEAFTFLTDAEIELFETDPAYQWWGDEYLKWVKDQLDHFNRPYHVAAMWGALSAIVGPWGLVPKAGAESMNCNLYINAQGMSSSGKTEAWNYGNKFIDVFYGIEDSPVIADAKKATALSIHRALILRDGKSSMVYSDEVQGFFQDLKKTHWQGSILSDLSDYYGGNVPPKHTMNDKEISGKRAKTNLSVYFTGIARQTLDAIDLDMWTSGLFYRFMWTFGYPRIGGAQKLRFKTKPSASAAAIAAATGVAARTQLDDWADEFKRVQRVQEFKPGWGAVREVYWEDDAIDRFNDFVADMDKVTSTEKLYSEIFVAANGRFSDSIMKVATIIALLEGSEMVTLRAVQIAIGYAGPWHKSMTLAVAETSKDAFRREVDNCLEFIWRNANRQVGRKPYIQRNVVMRQFFPNEVGERILRQLVEEGWIARSGDIYEVIEMKK